MPELCSYQCKQESEVKEGREFRGKVLNSLEDIKSAIKEIKENGREDIKELWKALAQAKEDANEDFKALYWKVGAISGVIGFVTSLITAIVVSLLRRG